MIITLLLFSALHTSFANNVSSAFLPTPDNFVLGMLFNNTEKISTWKTHEIYSFCARTKYLLDNYDPYWDIGPQLQVDKLSCHQILNTSDICQLDNADYLEIPPQVSLKGLLHFSDFFSPAARQEELERLSTDEIDFHCKTAKQLLLQFKPFWQGLNQILFDLQFCMSKGQLKRPQIDAPCGQKPSTSSILKHNSWIKDLEIEVFTSHSFSNVLHVPEKGSKKPFYHSFSNVLQVLEMDSKNLFYSKPNMKTKTTLRELFIKNMTAFQDKCTKTFRELMLPTTGMSRSIVETMGREMIFCFKINACKNGWLCPDYLIANKTKEIGTSFLKIHPTELAGFGSSGNVTFTWDICRAVIDTMCTYDFNEKMMYDIAVWFGECSIVLMSPVEKDFTTLNRVTAIVYKDFSFTNEDWPHLSISPNDLLSCYLYNLGNAVNNMFGSKHLYALPLSHLPTHESTMVVNETNWVHDYLRTIREAEFFDRHFNKGIFTDNMTSYINRLWEKSLTELHTDNIDAYNLLCSSLGNDVMEIGKNFYHLKKEDLTRGVVWCLKVGSCGTDFSCWTFVNSSGIATTDQTVMFANGDGPLYRRQWFKSAESATVWNYCANLIKRMLLHDFLSPQLQAFGSDLELCHIYLPYLQHNDHSMSKIKSNLLRLGGILMTVFPHSRIWQTVVTHVEDNEEVDFTDTSTVATVATINEVNTDFHRNCATSFAAYEKFAIEAVTRYDDINLATDYVYYLEILKYISPETIDVLDEDFAVITIITIQSAVCGRTLLCKTYVPASYSVPFNDEEFPTELNEIRYQLFESFDTIKLWKHCRQVLDNIIMYQPHWCAARTLVADLSICLITLQKEKELEMTIPVYEICRKLDIDRLVAPQQIMTSNTCASCRFQGSANDTLLPLVTLFTIPFVAVGGAAEGGAAGVGAGAGGTVAGFGKKKLPFKKPKDNKNFSKRKNQKKKKKTEKSTTTTTTESTESKEKESSEEEETTTQTTTTTTEAPAPVCYKEIQQHENNSTFRGRRAANLLKEDDYPKSPLGRCRLVINEVNSKNPGIDSKEFIELLRVCDGKARQKKTSQSLKGYHIFIIKGFPPKIIFHADLQSATLTDIPNTLQAYWVLGSNQVENTDLTFDSPYVKLASDPLIREDGNIPNGASIPNLVLLVYASNPFDMRYVTLPTEMKDGEQNIYPRIVTEEIQNKLIKFKQDCLVYGEKTNVQTCNIFSTICPELNTRPDLGYVLRDWEEPGHRDLSVGRCATHWYPFDFLNFKLTVPTPGRPNQCDDAVPIIVADRIIDLAPFAARVDVDVNEEDPMNCGNPAALGGMVPLISFESYRGLTENERQNIIRDCWPTEHVQTKFPREHRGHRKLKEFEIQRTGGNPDTNLWTATLNEETINELRGTMSDLVDVNVVQNPEYGGGLEIIPDDEGKYRFRCGICHRWTDSGEPFDRPSSHYLTPLMQPEGMLHTGDKAFTKNTNSLKAHSRHRVHLDAVEWLMEEKGLRNRKRTREAMEDSYPPVERYHKPTENVFMLAIEHVIESVAFRLWPKKMGVIKVLEVPVGEVYHTPRGLKKIIKSVSDDIQQHLHTEILQGRPLTLMLDGYTSQHTGMHYMAMAFQMLYLDTPKTVYFKTVKLGGDQTAEAYLKAIMDAIDEEPGAVRSMIRRNVYGLAADGTNTNRGSVNSIRTRLAKELGRPTIFFQWCYSHRENLVVKHSYEGADFQYFQDIIKSLSSLHVVFGPTTNHRERLKEKLNQEGKPAYVIQGVHEIRWVGSLRRALLKLFRIFEEVVAVLEDMNRMKLTANLKERVTSLLYLMKTPHFITSLAFLLDVFSIFDQFSVYSQTRHALLIDQVDIRANLLRSIRAMNRKHGIYLQMVLERADCGKDVEEDCSLEDMELRGTEYKGVKLEKDRQHLYPYRLSFLKPLYTRNIVEQLEQYFPREESLPFLMFNPRQFEVPEDVNVRRQNFADGIGLNLFPYAYAEQAVETVSKDIGWFTEESRHFLKSEWNNLIHHVVIRPDFVDLRQMQTSEFYLKIISDTTLPWTPATTRFVANLLVIPSSTAEIERYFSDVTFTLGDFRTQITPSVLDQLVRIRKYFPTDVSGQDFIPFVKSFIKKGNCRVDDKTCGYYSKERREYVAVENELEGDQIFVEGEIFEEEEVESMIIDDMDNDVAAEYAM